jgi:hypothetical protein
MATGAADIIENGELQQPQFKHHSSTSYARVAEATGRGCCCWGEYNDALAGSDTSVALVK